jgi:hypothetical protein
VLTNSQDDYSRVRRDLSQSHRQVAETAWRVCGAVEDGGWLLMVSVKASDDHRKMVAPRDY